MDSQAALQNLVINCTEKFLTLFYNNTHILEYQRSSSIEKGKFNTWLFFFF